MPDDPPSDSWYEVVEGRDLLQGDSIDNCPVLIPPDANVLLAGGDSITVAVEQYDVVVVSHSCDLLQGKLNNVIVCPHFSFEEIEQQQADFKHKRMKERMRRGMMPAYHMLASCSLGAKERGIRVVDFSSIFALPLAFVQDVAANCGPRLRLRSPYLEDFSQAFARFFMRVALPVEIPSFTDRPKATLPQ